MLAGGQPEIVGGESETFPLAETVDSPLRQQSARLTSTAATTPALMSTWQTLARRIDLPVKVKGRIFRLKVFLSASN